MRRLALLVFACAFLLAGTAVLSGCVVVPPRGHVRVWVPGYWVRPHVWVGGHWRVR